MRISGVAKCLWEMFLPVWAGACGESGKMMPRLANRLILKSICLKKRVKKDRF